MSSNSLRRSVFVFAVAGAVVGAWSRPALASCAAPDPAIAFSYPGEATGSVPQNAMFWAVANLGVSAQVTFDGVELQPRGDGVDHLQFVPSSPPTLGAHELTLTVDAAGLTSGPVFEETLRFEVAEPAAFDAHGEIVAVTRYPLPYPEGTLPNPYLEALEGDCSARSVPLFPLCLDSFPQALVRVELDLDPSALGYVVGNHLLPADCEAFVYHDFWEAPSSADAVRSLLPTGLGEPVPFTEAPREIEYEPPPGTYRDGPPGWCSMSFGGPPRPAAAWLALIAFVALWALRRPAAR